METLRWGFPGWQQTANESAVTQKNVGFNKETFLIAKWRCPVLVRGTLAAAQARVGPDKSPVMERVKAEHREGLPGLVTGFGADW